MDLLTFEIIAKTGATVSGIILSCVSIVQIIHLYKIKNSKGMSVLSMFFVITGFVLNIPYLIYFNLVILLIGTIIQFLLTSIVILMIFYYKHEHKLEISNDINLQYSTSNLKEYIDIEDPEIL